MKGKARTITDGLLQETRFISLFIFCFLLFTSFIVEPSFVPTSSMVESILPGDYLITTKYNYGYSRYSIPFNLPIIKDKIMSAEPERGDVIVFQPPQPSSPRYVKRLIGIPGDKIQILDDHIFINDIPVQRTYINTQVIDGIEYDRYIEVLPNNVSYVTVFATNQKNKLKSTVSNGVFYVPQNEYFFMGDNRYLSSDSRLGLGYVPFTNLVAKVRFVFFSTKIQLWASSNNIYQFVANIIPWIRSIRYERILKKVP